MPQHRKLPRLALYIGFVFLFILTLLYSAYGFQSTYATVQAEDRFTTNLSQTGYEILNLTQADHKAVDVSLYTPSGSTVPSFNYTVLEDQGQVNLTDYYDTTTSAKDVVVQYTGWVRDQESTGLVNSLLGFIELFVTAYLPFILLFVGIVLVGWFGYTINS